MQVNPTPSSLQTGSQSLSTKGDSLEQGAVSGFPQFSKLFATAEKQPSRLTEIGNNTYRMVSFETITTETDTPISEKKEDELITNTALPLETIPFLNLTQAPTININLESHFTKVSPSTSAVMVQVISHIRSLAATYHTVEFDIPEYQVGIKITGVGPTLKITVATTDDTLRHDLKANQGDLSQILRRELASPTLELVLDPNAHGQGQNSQDSNSNRQQNEPTVDEDDTEL